MATPPTDITRLLRDVDDDKPGAMNRLMDVVYDDLNRVAERHMAERMGAGLPGVTWEPGALVNESFLKLIRQRNRYDNRGHFFAIATKVMLRVLVDYQRRRQAEKRGGGRERITLSFADAAAADTAGNAATATGPTTLIEIDSLVTALGGLDALDPRKADVVKLRVIWGLEMREIAESLGVSLATVERDWAFAKAWLSREAAEQKS